ncbi:hypothetical protein Scep_019548 [Stephania cephalantha]|uniref:Uncharacterized protein n=1 Tax=Stephania cephalantha TaxID=152367 RepID=A0AAP0NN10_9MAGN
MARMGDSALRQRRQGQSAERGRQCSGGNRGGGRGGRGEQIRATEDGEQILPRYVSDGKGRVLSEEDSAAVATAARSRKRSERRSRGDDRQIRADPRG